MSLSSNASQHGFIVLIWLFLGAANMILMFDWINSNANIVSIPTQSNSTTKRHNAHSVDIVLTTDQHYKLPMYTLINSIILNEKPMNYNRLYFHILVLNSNKTALYEQEIVYYFKKYLNKIRFEVKAMTDYAECVTFNKTVSRYTIFHRKENTFNKPMLLSRFCVPFIFPDISIAVFLDSDMIVMESISKLYDEYYHTHDYIAWSVMNKKARQQFNDLYLNETRSMLFNQYFNGMNPQLAHINFTQIRHVFNGGLLMFNFDIWRKYNFTKQSIDLFKFENLYTTRYKQRPWYARTQPVVNLLFILNKLQVGDLGNDWNWIMHSESKHTKSGHKIENAKLVHWSGPHKPWKETNVFGRHIWIQHIPQNANVTEWQSEFNISLI